MRKSFILLFLILLIGCKKEPKIVLNNYNEDLEYSNIDSIDYLPSNFKALFPKINIAVFDAFEMSKNKKLTEINGDTYNYILHHIFVCHQNYIRYALGERSVDYDESRYMKNSQVYACGDFNVAEGVTSCLIFEKLNDEITSTNFYNLYLFNIKGDRLYSNVKISNFFKPSLNGLCLKTYYENSFFFTSGLHLRESSLSKKIPKSIISNFQLKMEKVKVLDYCFFSIESDGYVCTKTI